MGYREKKVTQTLSSRNLQFQETDKLADKLVIHIMITGTWSKLTYLFIPQMAPRSSVL